MSALEIRLLYFNLYPHLHLIRYINAESGAFVIIAEFQSKPNTVYVFIIYGVLI